MVAKRGLIRVLLAMLWLVASAPTSAKAQTSGVTLIINSCDSSNFPEVSCIVTPVNGAGVPLQNLDPSSFQVMEGTTPATNLQVQQITGSNVKTSIMLVVDFGMVHRGSALQPLKDSATAILQAASNDDRIGIIAIIGPVKVDSSIDPSKEFAFANAGQKRNDMINLINSLNAVASTPLYDAVCKALLLTAQESVGNRAVIVLSDGHDAKSTVCSESDPITRANHDRTPVFTIGVGPDVNEAYMRKLALQTDGDYTAAASLTNVTDIFRRIEKELKTQYRLSFHVGGTSNGQARSLVIQVTQGPNQAKQTVSIQTKAVPKPTFDKVTFTVNGVEANPLLLPANKTVIIQPTIGSAVPVTQVEYIVGNQSTVISKPPFQLVIATNDLLSLNKITLKAAGDLGNPDSMTIADVSIGIDPATLVTPTVVLPTATPKPSLLKVLTTFPGILIPISAVGILLLLIFLIVLLARRRGASEEAQGSESPKTMVVGQEAFGESSPATAVIDSSPTSLMNDGGASPGGETRVLGASGEGGQTLVFKPPIALLEFQGGNLAGQQFSVGATNMEKLSIGRDPDTGPGAVRINSQYVSRKHAVITVDGTKMYLMDLGSASGTKLNGERLPASQQREVKIGDKIEFADVAAELKQA